MWLWLLFNFLLVLKLTDEGSGTVLVLKHLQHLRHLVTGLIFNRHLDVLDVLSHIGQGKVADNTHCLALKWLLYFLFLPTFFAHWGFKVNSFLLKFKELVWLCSLLLLPLCFLLSDRSSWECHLLNLTHDISLLIGKCHWRGHLTAWATVRLLQLAGRLQELRALVGVHHAEKHLWRLLHLEVRWWVLLDTTNLKACGRVLWTDALSLV